MCSALIFVSSDSTCKETLTVQNEKIFEARDYVWDLTKGS